MNIINFEVAHAHIDLNGSTERNCEVRTATTHIVHTPGSFCPPSCGGLNILPIKLQLLHSVHTTALYLSYF